MKSKIVVADTTPLIVLGNSGHLNILRDLFEEIYIPKAVLSEVLTKLDDASNAIVNEKNWIVVCSLEKEMSNFFFNHILGEGEKEAILLAEEINADLIILDDERARKEAISKKLNIIGTAGILLLAKRKGLIQTIKPYLTDVCSYGLYLSDEQIRLILDKANEL